MRNRRYLLWCVVSVLFLIDPCISAQQTYPCFYRRGDATADGTLDISDPTQILNYLFQGRRTITCHNAADANKDDKIDISDAVFLLDYLFLGGPPPDPDELNCLGPQSQPPHPPIDEIWASCPNPVIASHEFMVVHAGRSWEPKCNCKGGMDFLLSQFGADRTVFILECDAGAQQHLQFAADWITRNGDPRCSICASTGTFYYQDEELRQLEVTSPELTIAGGYFEECWNHAVSSAVASYFGATTSGTMTLHVPMDAVFTGPNSLPYEGPTLLHNYSAAESGKYTGVNPAVTSGDAYVVLEAYGFLKMAIGLTSRSMKLYVDDRNLHNDPAGSQTVELKLWTSSLLVPAPPPP